MLLIQLKFYETLIFGKTICHPLLFFYTLTTGEHHSGSHLLTIQIKINIDFTIHSDVKVFLS